MENYRFDKYTSGWKEYSFGNAEQLDEKKIKKNLKENLDGKVPEEIFLGGCF